MIDLEQALSTVGSRLAVPDDESIVTGVLARVDTPPAAERRARIGWIAAVAIVVVAIIVAVPDARRTMADWFGLDGVTISRDPRVDVTGASPSFEMPGPGSSDVVTVDGHDILVSAVAGSLPDQLIDKMVGTATAVLPVNVMGDPGLWIEGDPHLVSYSVMYEAGDEVVVERVAGNTLLWQSGPTLYRVEGFASLDAALEFARMLTGTDEPTAVSDEP